jgi:hypothetical protein
MSKVVKKGKVSPLLLSQSRRSEETTWTTSSTPNSWRFPDPSELLLRLPRMLNLACRLLQLATTSLPKRLPPSRLLPSLPSPWRREVLSQWGRASKLLSTKCRWRKPRENPVPNPSYRKIWNLPWKSWRVRIWGYVMVQQSDRTGIRDSGSKRMETKALTKSIATNSRPLLLQWMQRLRKWQQALPN